MEKLEATNGPDEILPSTVYHTTEISKPVKIRFGETEVGKKTPISVPTVLARAAAECPDRAALGYKKNPEDKEFRVITFKEYHQLTRTVAKAFLKLGLEKFHSVCILGFNSPEWFLSCLGAIHAGGVATGIYTTNSAEATYYVLKQSGVNIAVAEDEKQVKKILAYKDQLPGLKAIIQYCGKPEEGVLSWEQLLEIGRKETDEALDSALKKIAVNQCCSLIYTSGTTGNPKGVMLSHDNCIWCATSLGQLLSLKDNERIVSYLPLSHVAAQSIDIYCALLFKVTVYFANRDALKGGLIKTLHDVRPTRFLGVPRIWEKIAEKMKSIGASAGPIKKSIAVWAKSQGLQRNTDLMKGINNPSFSYLLARAFVFSKIKANLGLDQCKSCWTGAAPLSSDIKLYFASLDVLVLDAFGMSETSGVQTLSTEYGFKLESVGRTIPGAKTKISNPDEDRQGEICLQGRHIFMGYLNDKEKTEETLDNEGWLHTGDLGKLDKDGYLFITGRLKEILITSGGENIAPVVIEQNIKAELPCLGQAVVICDKKKFLSLLVTLSCEVNPETGEASNELADTTKNWLREVGCSFNTITEVMASGPDKKILDAIQAGIDAANLKAISNAQKVQKFAVLPKDFSVATGELGPTLKLRRAVITEKYSDIIEGFYK
ncbi:UNVERIFIED_CONTAM: hypothetical protein PYX00_000926 [Menopon gallinae]|uniref:long-chain-fatty-acid--CoA ligase n=1 Tax=Menopon gallinae TaxID=328185 RepID=A0AAW2IC41_9NEOP